MIRTTFVFGIILLLSPSLPAQRDKGEEVPDFEYTRLDGRESRLSDHRGKIVVLDFFSCWWLASRNNIVHLQEVHNQYRDRGVDVLGLARDGMEELKRFVAERPGDVTYTVGVSGEADRKFRVGYIPHMFIIDPLGRLYWHGEPGGGPFRHDLLQARLDRALRDLMDEWPGLLRESAGKALAEACERLEKATTPCEFHEAVMDLRKIPSIFHDVKDVAAKAENRLDELSREHASRLRVAEASYDDLRSEARLMFDLIEKEGSLLEKGQAKKYIKHLEAVSNQAGSQSRLSRTIKDFIRELEESYEGPPFLGVRFDSNHEAEGVAIQDIIKGTAAEKYGLMAGDVIVEIDGKRMERIQDVNDLLAKRKPGQKIEVKIKRGGKGEPQALDIILGRRP